VTGRLLDLPEDRRPGTPPPPSTTTNQLVSIATLPPPATIPAALRRPLRLPGLRRDGSCPTSPTVGPSITPAHPVAAVAVGDGPVIVRGHRLGAPKDQVRFQQDQQQSRPVHVLDPATAYPTGDRGSWWPKTRLRAGPGCYGLQIDGAEFSEVLVVEFG
jgi:hypothetical protein